MQNFHLLFESSPWFIFLCLLTGALYAFLLYQRKGPWSKQMNYVLTALRFVTVSVLAFLLIGPFIRQIRNTTEDPTVIIAIDNSSSIQEEKDSVQLRELVRELKTLKAGLEQNNYQVAFRSLSEDHNLNDINQLTFDHPSTNLEQMLKKIQRDYEGRNLQSVVLVSDGIYNQGVSPLYSAYNYTINTLALGDTMPKKDVNLRALYYNKMVYQGNKFPLMAEIGNYGFDGEQVSIAVKRDGKVLSSETLQLAEDKPIQQVEFVLDADEEGMQRYTVEVDPLEGEYSERNNTRDAFVDIVEGKEKILLVALSPHPDIKAIRAALDTKPNYDLKLYIPGIHAFEKDKYDLVIFHQVPNLTKNGLEVVKNSIDNNTSLWFILGTQSNLQRFNNSNQVVKLQVQNRQLDEVTPTFNKNFDIFTFEDKYQVLINDYPPVTVPFGNIDLSPDVQVLLYQKVGSIVTSKPLLLVSGQRKPKTAIMLGEGLWKWRLHEYAQTEDHEAFDQLISKMVQYLSAKEDKRKFKVYPVKKEFDHTEEVVFESEVYNDIYERIYGFKIDLLLSSSESGQKNYTFTTTKSNSQFRLTGLEPGIYNYEASVNIKGQKEAVTGMFTIENLQLETVKSTADHQMLRQLASSTGGALYYDAQMDRMRKDLSSLEAKGVLHSNESYLPIIDLKILFFALLVLISIEWFIRKFSGSY